MNIDSFVAEVKPKIEEVISHQISNFGDDASQVSKIVQQGKRLRPLVTMLSFRLCNGSDEAKALEVAASGEFAHTASLLKDELIDADPTRRGNPAFWTQAGSVENMRIADRVIAQGVSVMASAGLPLLDTFLGAWGNAWKGESKEWSIVSGIEKMKPVSKQIYYEVIGQKTGSLYAAAARLGSQCASSQDDVSKNFYQWGWQLGVLYQLADDMVDLRKGKPEALARSAIMDIDEKIKNMATDALTKGKVSPLELFSKGSIDTESFYKKEISEAKERLQALFSLLPVQKEYTPVASAFPDYIVEQQLAELQDQVTKNAS